MLLNIQWVTEEIKEEILKIPGDKQKWKHIDPKSMGLSKTILRGKFIRIQTYLRKQEKSQINSNHSPKGTRRRTTTNAQG